MSGRIPSLAFSAVLLCSSTMAQGEPPELKVSEKDAQNFEASATGELRIVGDEARYDIILPADVLFDFDKSQLRADAALMLEKLKAHFAAHKASQVHVRGHTDSKGTPEYNYTLSQNRAAAVCRFLREHAGLTFTNCIGRGEDEPLVPNENADGSDNPKNRQLNRRVTVSVVFYPDTKAMLEKAKRDADAARSGQAAP